MVPPLPNRGSTTARYDSLRIMSALTARVALGLVYLDILKLGVQLDASPSGHVQT